MSELYEQLKKLREQQQSEQQLPKPAAPGVYKNVEASPTEPTTEAKVKGYLGGATVEMTGGISGSLAYMKWLNRAKWASKATKLNPVSWTNPVGWATMAGGEAAIWGLSNLAGQEVRKYYGLQDATHLSEVYASALFGLTPINKLVEGRKVFEFAQPALGASWKSKALTVGINGTKTMVSGATLGVLESAFRQTAAVMMGEEENFEEYDFYMSAVAGGGVNTAIRGAGSLWHMWRNSGAWGRGQATEAVNRVQQNLEAQEAELVSKIEKAKAPVKSTNPWVSAYGGMYQAGKAAGIREMEKKLATIQQAKNLNEKASIEINESNSKAEELEKAAVDKKEEAPYTEDDLEVVEPKAEEPEATPTVEEPEVIAPRTEEPTVEEPEVTAPKADEPTVEEPAVTTPKVEEPAPKAPEEPQAKTEEPKAPEQPTDLPEHEVTFNKLKERLENITLKDNAATEGPAVGVEANALKIERETKLGAAIHHVFVNKNADTGQIQNALDLVKFIRKLNTEVLDKIKVPGGRMVQSQRMDAGQFKFDEEKMGTSSRAREEDFRLGELEKALQERIDGNAEVELDKLHLNFLNVVPEAKAEGKKIGKRVREDFDKQERRRKLVEDAEESVDPEVARNKRIESLQKQLEAERAKIIDKTGGQQGKKKTFVKSEEEVDLENRIKFYKTGGKEAAETSALEERLETLLELAEEGDLSKIRQEVGPAPDWAKPKQVKSYLNTLRKVVDKTRKDLQQKVIDSDITLQDPNKVAKQQAKEKAKLQKRLKQLQQRFGKDSKLKPKDAAKKAEANAEIEDLKDRIQFYEANERDALKLEQRLKERDRLLKIETGRLGAQRDEITPKPKGPKKTPGKLEKVESDIAFLRKNMRDRVREIDQARIDMEEAKTAAQLHDEEISKLDKELEQLRKEFGDDSSLVKDDVEGAPKKEKHPDILAKEAQIKFHKEARQEAITLDKKIAERNRLLALETGPLGAQRAEVTKSTKTDNKAPGRIEKLNEDIAFLKKNMRDRVREIDKAREEMTPEFQAAQLAKAHDRAITKLDKELEQLQKEFGDMDAVEAEAGAVKPPKEKHPDIKDREERIKWHKGARKEALEIAKLEKELADTVEMESREVMGEMRAATDPKPTGPQQPLKSAMLRKQINESKARMRKKVADIDRAKAKMDEEASNVRILKAVEQHLYKVMLDEPGNKAVNFARQALVLRQLAMIDQAASATAGLGTGIAGTFKQFYRPWATLFHDLVKNRPMAWKNFTAEVAGLSVMLKDWEGGLTAFKRTWKAGESATRVAGGRNRLTDEKQYGRRIDHRNLKKVVANAERQVEAKRNLKNYLSNTPLGRLLWTSYELGMRSILAIDEIPSRQFFKGQQTAEAIQKGHISFPDDPDKAYEHAQELLNSWWKDDDGLRVLTALGEQQNSTSYVNQELLFAGNAAEIDESEFALTIADTVLSKFWRPITNLKYHPSVSLGFRFIAPFMTVALRAGGRLARVGVPGLGAVQMTNAPIVGNPYNKRLKDVDNELLTANKRIREGDLDEKAIADERKYIDQLHEKRERIETRKIMYNRDALADQLLGATFGAAGFVGAYLGGSVVGSQAWMTEDQRNTYGAKEFTMFGWSFKEWIPISLALSLGADLGAWRKIKDIERRKGIKILNDDQDEVSVMIASALQLVKEMPFNQAIKNVEDLANDSASIATAAFAKAVGSIVPNPAQVKKIVKFYQAGGRVADLKGMGFWERSVYEAFGTGVKNWKTDHFGEDIETEMSGSQMIWRSFPDRAKEESEWDENLKLDHYSDIKKPASTFKGIPMKDFKREDGVTLTYAYNLELRKTNVKRDIDRIIKNKSWQKFRDQGSVPHPTNPDKRTNPALSQLNDTLKTYDDIVMSRFLSNRSLLSKFVSEKENEKGSADYRKYGPYETLQQRIDYSNFHSTAPDRFAPKSIEDLLKLPK
jgi:hypothetical protein